MTKCPKCRKGEVRQQVNVFVDAPMECRSLDKKGIRSKAVKILGVGWDQASLYCSRGCGYFVRLATTAPPTTP